MSSPDPWGVPGSSLALWDMLGGLDLGRGNKPVETFTADGTGRLLEMEQNQTFAKDGIRSVMKQVVAHGAEHGLGPEQFRTILDEVLIDYVDYGKDSDAT